MYSPKIISIALALAGLSGLASAADHHKYSQGPFDLAVADEFKLMDMLKKSGKISPTASFDEAQTALGQYLNQRMEEARAKEEQSEFDLAPQFQNRPDRELTSALQNGKGNKLGQAKQNAPDPIELEAYDGPQRTARVLAILMEFPDFPHNSINPEDTEMYYEDYAVEHYQRLLFSQSGWTAPNGINAHSLRSYYESQSGNSYSVEGAVAGWYMASKPAAYYGNNVDGDIRSLVREGLNAAAADPNIDLSQFDIEDRYDLDGDGNYWEPDGLVDHVMIFHSSVGEEAGGGQLGEDAIWAHRWNLGGVYGLEGTATDVPYWGGVMAAYDYTVQPADGASGVVSHEYGHDLGLPDEYDTQYTGRGEPVSSWSIMSNGSWVGRIKGTEPSGFSAWAKQFLQNSLGGNWLHGASVHIDDLPEQGVAGLLDQAASKGTNNDAIRVNLPDKETVVALPTSGEYAYFGGSDDNLFNRMSVIVDLSAASSAQAKFKTWYDIETDWDYAYMYVISNSGVSFVAGNITTASDPNGANRGNGITGSSGGWVDAQFDLSAFAGQTIKVTFLYETDGYVTNPGIYIDDFAIEADGAVIATDNADDDNELFAFAGFETNTGIDYTTHYYLLEWRTHQGIDSGLAYVNIAGESLSFDQGLLIWYADNKYSENWVGLHPGDGFLGVVDADRRTVMWSDHTSASTRYQIHDATFSLDKGEKVYLDLNANYNISLRDNHTKRIPLFDDSSSFISADIPDAGRNVPNYGLKVRVTSQSTDKSVGEVLIYK